MFRTCFHKALLTTFCMGAMAFAHAQEQRPISLVVTTTAGGSVDAVARHIAQELGKSLDRNIVVENRPGAGGNIAADYVKRAAPDGNTLVMLSSSTFTLNPIIYSELSFDPIKDFVPVAMPARLNMVLMTNPSLGTKNIQDFIAKLKAQPGQLNYGSSGNGSLPHIAGELLLLTTGTKAVHVPYKGIAPATNDLVAGRLDFVFDSGTGAPYVAAGKLNALAAIGPKRLAAYPNVPTFEEAGFPGMEAASGWYGIFAPAGTPRDIVDRLNREINVILDSAELQGRLDTMGLVPVSASPDELGQALAQDLRRFREVVEKANIKMN